MRVGKRGRQVREIKWCIDMDTEDGLISGNGLKELEGKGGLKEKDRCVPSKPKPQWDVHFRNGRAGIGSEFPTAVLSI